MKEVEEEKTAMPYSDLTCLIEYIGKKEHDYYHLGISDRWRPYPTKEEGEHFDRYSAFLEGVKKLYFECAGCERRVAPDEERYQDPASEAWYCMECLKEGI